MLRHSGILKKKELLLLPIVPFFRWNAFVRAAATSRKSFADTWEQSLCRSWYLCSFVCKSIIVLESHCLLSLSLSLSLLLHLRRKKNIVRESEVRTLLPMRVQSSACVCYVQRERERKCECECVRVPKLDMGNVLHCNSSTILIFLDSFLLNQNLQRWATMAGRPRSANL